MLNLIHSNRMEDLASALAEIISHPLSHPLKPESVMVQTQGLGQWLQWRLADAHGVCANMNFPFPAAWLWQLYIHYIDPGIPRGVFSKSHMAWLLFSMMEALSKDEALTPLQHYLQGECSERDVFQLSWALADCFDKYLVYRPDWVLEWESSTDIESWQGRVWLKLIEQYTSHQANDVVWHRARLLNHFLGQLKQGKVVSDALPERLLVFGVSALPPYMIEVLSELGRHFPVYLFMLNPCEFFWADTPSKKRLLEACDEPLSHEFHPLLASLGRCGRDLLQLLSDHIAFDIPLFTPSPSGSTLSHIQNSLLQGHLHRMDYQHGDHSVQIHSCHSRRREIEVLNDQLLALFDHDPALSPREVVVMAPDMQAYLPWVKAVFGRYEDARHIPWSAADVSKMHRLPLLATVLELFDLPHKQLTVNEVLDWLMIPVIASSRGVNANDKPMLANLLRDSEIHWGLSANHREELGYRTYDRHTFEFGLDRLIMGALVGDSVAFSNGMVPVPVNDTVVQHYVLIIDQWINDLERWRTALQHTRTASQWCDWVCEWLNEVFGNHEQAIETTSAVREIMLSWSATVNSAQCSGGISHAVLSEVLRGEFTQRDAGLTFMGRGVTFCSLTPMRSIPFKVVCLLGMSEGDYPRYDPPSGLDLMALHPRKGDRIRKDEDRFLFLEAILSARDVLYISYIGRDMRDNSIRLASSVVLELLSLLVQLFNRKDQNDSQCWVTEHPLQPFSPAYFMGETLGSYAAEWIHPVPLQNSGDVVSARRDLKNAEAVDWKMMVDFWQHPVRHFCKQVAKLSDSPVQERLSDVEPQTVNPLNSYQWRADFFHTIFNARQRGDPFRYWQAAGKMVEVSSAKSIFKHEQAAIDEWLEHVCNHYEWNKNIQSFERDVQGIRVKGAVENIDRSWLVRACPTPLRWDHRLHFWLEWLLMNTIAPMQGAHLWFFDTNEGCMKKEELLPVDNADVVLHHYLQRYVSGLKAPLLFYPRFNGELFDRTVINKKALSDELDKLLREERYYDPRSDRWVTLILQDRDIIDPHVISNENDAIFSPILPYWVCP